MSGVGARQRAARIERQRSPGPTYVHGKAAPGFRWRSTRATGYELRYFFAWLKYFRSGGAWPFFDGINRPSALRK
jgi:hypothetical protein